MLAATTPVSAVPATATFRAMGSDWTVKAHVSAADIVRLAVVASQLVEEIEQELSRFRPRSLLSRLNAGERVDQGSHLLPCVELALRGHHLTSGAFDPTIHDALTALGYDDTVETVRNRAQHDVGRVPAVPGIDGVHVDHDRHTVRLATGVRLDLGGVGKGYAADLVAQRLAALVGSVLIDAGGDIAVRSEGAGDAWPVSIEGDADVEWLVADAGVATSGSDRRRWPTSRGMRHHVIDPRTGDSASSDLARVTVICPRLADADVLATAALVLGSGRAQELLDQYAQAHVLQLHNGAILRATREETA
jgi:thiamine biosynthesis lipoprotein